MQLPVIMPDLGSQRYDCNGCTDCCRELVVQITKEDRERIDRHRWKKKLGVEPYVPLGRNMVLNHTPDGGCVFLTEDGRCRIHAEHGADQKPLACRLYPFTVDAEASAVRAGIRFDCPSVAGNRGGPLPQHRGEMKQLATETGLQVKGFAEGSDAPLQLIRGLGVSPPTADRLVDQFARYVRDERRLFSQRMSGLCGLTQTLEQSSLASLDEERILELVTLLATELQQTEERDPSPPTERQLRMLRQAVFAHCEHITFQQARAPMFSALAYRWKQLRRAKKFIQGSGPTPDLGPFGGGVDASRVDAIKAEAGFQADAGDQLLTRYVVARVSCRTAFGNAYYGWSMIDGLHSLLLAVACVGWLSRFSALVDGRSCYNLSDVERAVRIVDRSAGRAAELGAPSARLRLQYLTRDSGLQKLLRAYAL